MVTKKQTSKKILSFLLAVVMLVGIAQIPMFANINAEAATEYKVGDIVEFGSYPQTLVTDKELIDVLNDTKLTIYSYRYYCESKQGDWMSFGDVTYNGSRYRGVRIEEYRPHSTGGLHTENVQEKNGYSDKTTYWFKYEPIKWRVLDPEKGLILSDVIIDSQPYSNTLKDSMYNEYGNFATDYKSSSIREWLHTHFETTAFSSFTEEEFKKIAKKTVNDNSAAEQSPLPTMDLNGVSTEDYYFLLSYKDATNENYGFTNNESRKAFATDYAKCQGLQVYDKNGDTGTYSWILRGADGFPSTVSSVFSTGSMLLNLVNDVALSGIRPAMTVDLSKIKNEGTGSGSGEDIGSGEGTGSDSDTNVNGFKVGDIVEFGSYPQTLVTDKDLIDTLNKSKATIYSYRYYSSNKPGDWMAFCDVTYNGSRYRGVAIEEYRPHSTAGLHTENVQERNGYKNKSVYWFKYEPIKWRVLDPEKGLILSDVIIDTQPYSNILKESMYNQYGNFATDYKSSSIREWLHTHFETTAFSSFTEEEFKKIAKKTVNDNSAAEQSPLPTMDLNGVSTEDYYFLLSYKDATNENYGFANNESRKAVATDYAKCQGLQVYDKNGDTGTYSWILRGADGFPSTVSSVFSTGSMLFNLVNDVSLSGIRPAMTVDLSKLTKGDTGEKPGDGTGTDDSGSGTDKEPDKETSGKKLSVSLGSINVYYNISKSINPTITVEDGVKYTVSYKVKDTSVAKIDENNRIIGLKLGEKTTLTCIVTDEFGNKAESSTEIRVDYSFCQFIVLTITEFVKTLIKIITALI